MEFSYYSLTVRLPKSDSKRVLNVWFRLMKINIVIALTIFQAYFRTGLTEEKIVVGMKSH